VNSTRPITTLADLRRQWPDLADAAVVALDLRKESLDWPAARLEGTFFLGCRFPEAGWTRLATSGAAVLSSLEGLPFQPYRGELYRYEELTSRREDCGETLDDRIASWFTSSSPTSLPDLTVRALHDAAVDAAVARFVAGRRMVGVMGGHALARDAALYRTVADLGRTLTRDGFSVTTGGGPGAMEAANLGAWFAPFDDGQLDRAMEVLTRAPVYATDPDRHVEATLEVRRRWPEGAVSLGVPTWVYADEPTAGFATHIAKYFTNSIREDGLLAIARSGVIYTPGGAGTEQEIFTDTAQNSLTLYQVRSPMVFLDRHHFEVEHPELVAAARRQASTFGWDDLITVCDDPFEAAAFVARHDPDASGHAGVERRRAHRDRRR
jgi:predicted Rossmann-fold nucleotide-binding protein